MPRNNQNSSNRGRRSNNNNPEGRNQYNSGWMDMARERPATAAAAAAGAVAAGVFLWSKRNQISDQLSHISEQIGEWTDSFGPEGNREFETVGGEPSFSGSSSGTPGQFESSPTGTSPGLSSGSSPATSGRRGSSSAGRGPTSPSGSGRGRS